MEKEFIPYEQALALKKLGFDELCFGWYHHKLIVGKEYSILEFENCKNKESWITGKHCSAPLYQQAFRWFKEKYNLLHIIHCNNKGYFATITEKVNGITPCIFSSEIFKSYEEAELECLKKLIEITIA